MMESSWRSLIAFSEKRGMTLGPIRTASATCEGRTSKNGFYGNGIVNAYAAVTGRH